MANWKNILNALAVAGKVAAPVALNAILPGSGGIVQLVEYAFGAGTGAEKKAVAAQIGMVLLDAMAKSGRLDSAAPAVAEIEKTVQTVVDAMKSDGTLEEVGMLKLGRKSYQITVMGKLPE